MKKINIMTSCDNNIAKYVFPQLVSINKHLSDYDVCFYLVHNRITADNIQMLKEFVKSQTKIKFCEILIEDISFYDSFVEDGGKLWPAEAYFTLCVQDYLPRDVDRIMYIDAGDVIFTGDISPYYFDDFEGNSIIATPLTFKINSITNEKELYSIEDRAELAIGSLFNSGSYIINVEKFRNEGYTQEYYKDLHKTLKKENKFKDFVYYGDQGLLASAFVGDVRMFGYPDVKDILYMPYNFRTSYWGITKNELTYEPVVIHYAVSAKPWDVRFDKDILETVISKPDSIVKQTVVSIPNIQYLTEQHMKYCEIWWGYASETPIYYEVDIKARATAESWIKHYFPLCSDYVNLYKRIDEQSEKLKQIEQRFKKKEETEQQKIIGLMRNLSSCDIKYMSAVIKEIISENMPAAQDEIFRLSEDDIPDEHAESYLFLASNICAINEYADGWLMFQKEYARYLNETGRKDEAQMILDNLEGL